jgi:uncharacterized membrane protein
MSVDTAAAARERRRVERSQAREAGPATLYDTGWGRLLLAAFAALALATAGGLVALWPHGDSTRHASEAMGGATVGATVTRALTVRCPGPVAERCRRIDVRLASGVTTGMTLGPERAVAAVSPGSRVRVRPTGDPQGDAYAFANRDRRRTLLWIALAFAAMIVALARLRGLLALAGLGASILLMTRFLVPAILAGEPALLVALAGSLAVMFVTVVLTYGLTAPSMAACLGIAGSLLLAALAGTVFAGAAGLDGRSSDLAAYLASTDSALSLRGVMLSGLVIGALGVLADMGVTQASTVMALRKANPRLGATALFRRAFGVGRDHLVATTHTLVLVYLGATLPLLLVLSASGVNTTDALNTQDVAEPIVATLVGAMALLVSVPLTTGLCAAVAHRIPAASLGEVHAHEH